MEFSTFFGIRLIFWSSEPFFNTQYLKVFHSIPILGIKKKF